MSTNTKMECSIRELIESDSLSWIFVGGKGGVGKTTTASSIAVQLAKRREKVLILSTDPAHNIGDAFKQKLAAQPTLINGFSNLYAMEIDPVRPESAGFKARTSNDWTQLLPDLVQMLPGIDEAISFAEIMQNVQTMLFSVIVFDTAPTGHTLRLLGFPELLQQGLNKILSLKSTFSGAISVVNAMSGGNLHAEDISERLNNLRAITCSIRNMFQDPKKTTFICVCIPEFLSVYETERLIQELAKQNIDCSNIVVNQVLFPIEPELEEQDISTPPDITPDSNQTTIELVEKIKRLQKRVLILEENLLARRKMQSRYLSQIQDLYGDDFHIVPIPQRSQELRGIEDLELFGRLLMSPREMPII